MCTLFIEQNNFENIENTNPCSYIQKKLYELSKWYISED